MKILHCADLHVGCCRRYPDSLRRARLAFRDILNIAKEHECEVLVVAGDWFDSSAPNHEERALVSEMFRRCPIPIVSITGNHDKWGRELGQTALNWLSGLAPKFGHRVWGDRKSVV
jgi:exonuclease SbcD